MSNAKQQRPTHKSPRARVVYAFLNGDGKDYQGNGKFQYVVKASFPAGAETDEFAARLDALGEDGLRQVNEQIMQKNASPGAKKMPLKKALTFPVYERDEESGDLVVNFKAPTKITNRTTGETYSNRVRFFDAGGSPVEKELNVGKGTQGRVFFQTFNWLSPIGCGVRLEPKAFQVLDLVEFTGGGPKTAADYGIEAEDGYTFEAGETATDDSTDGSVDASEV